MAERLPENDGKEISPAEQSPLILTDKMLEADFDVIFREYPLSDDTTCGMGFIRGKWLQM